MVEDMKKVQAIYAESAQHHDEAMRALDQSRLDFERQIGHISESEYEQRTLREIQIAYKAARKKLEADKAAAKEGTQEYARAEAQFIKLADKYNSDVEKLEQKSYLRRRQQFDQYFKQISSSFNTALNGWIQGTETAGQAFGKMFQDILSQLISFIEQWVEKKLEMWLMDQFLTKEKASGSISASAGQTFAASYADMASLGPEGLAAAPGVAAAASGAVMGGAMALVASSAGGEWRVDRDRLNIVHANETILPAGIAGKLRELVESGGSSGVTVVVNHSVNAVDAQSFQGHIRRHGNMIGNEVARVLKRKGFAMR